MQMLELVARQCAKEFISPYVLRGDSLESLKAGCMGTGGGRYDAQIGGYAWFSFGKPGEYSISLKSSQVAVTEIGGVPCLFIFSLSELYDEIKHPTEQLTLLEAA